MSVFFITVYVFVQFSRQFMEFNCKENSKKTSESQMGFEPTILRDLGGCSNQWATGDYDEQGSIFGSTGTTSRGHTAK